MEISDLAEGMLVQSYADKTSTLLKVSTVAETRVWAQVVYPKPPRTQVRIFTPDEVDDWEEPSARIITAYEKAYDLEPEDQPWVI